MLDTQGLNVTVVHVNDQWAEFEMDSSWEALGKGLVIFSPEQLRKGSIVTVRVQYVTNSEQKAANWLKPE